MAHTHEGPLVLSTSAACKHSRRPDQTTKPLGCGSILNHQGTADVSPCFHIPGFHFGYLLLNHSHFVECVSIFPPKRSRWQAELWLAAEPRPWFHQRCGQATAPLCVLHVARDVAAGSESQLAAIGAGWLQGAVTWEAQAQLMARCLSGRSAFVLWVLQI